MSKQSTFILDTRPGEQFQKVTAKAISLSKEKGTVMFEFNGIICRVNQHTNADWLYRDYCNAFLLKENAIGPDTAETYSAERTAMLEKANKLLNEKIAAGTKQKEEKDGKQRDAFNKKTKDITFSVINKPFWDKEKELNADAYGSAILNFAESWARLMQFEISSGKTLEEIASTTSHELGFIDISGFQYGTAISVLEKHWEHGQQLRAWHNKYLTLLKQHNA